MYSTFQERFGQLLEEFEGSNVELAKQLKVSKQTVSAWKTGINSPKAPTVAYIARYFNVSIPWLMGLDVLRGQFTDSLPDGIHLTTEEELLVLAYRDATPEARGFAFDLLATHKKGASSASAM